MTPLMSSIVIGAGVVSFAVIMTVIGLRARRSRGTDLGEVSSQWVVEHRAGPGGHDPSSWNRR